MEFPLRFKLVKRLCEALRLSVRWNVSFFLSFFLSIFSIVLVSLVMCEKIASSSLALVPQENLGVLGGAFLVDWNLSNGVLQHIAVLHSLYGTFW